ncbi:hypothetical protein, partial [Micromonospora palomenae]|uniref:hypothetical protein n=1 Tax=Micromonospora palomenae TaxID=1461247 RepID=UPI003F895051
PPSPTQPGLRSHLPPETPQLKVKRPLRTTSLGGALIRRSDFGLLLDVLAKDELTPRDVVDAKRYLAGLNPLSTAMTRTKKLGR